MQNSETIAAISTPPGLGGVGMVRISGPQSLETARRIFLPAATWRHFPPTPGKAVVGRVHPPDRPSEPIDQAVFLFFQAPRSYTGEDTVELTTHGSPLVMRALLEACLAAGARLAEAGEFTRRAFLNGRMDLSQAEAVASLIHARTDEARMVMYNQVAGSMGKALGSLREILLQVKVVLESALDFSEDIEEPELVRIPELLDSGVRMTTALLTTASRGIAMEAGVSVVIAGTPNVGKSSLLNSLLKEDRAIVHEAAGTTRDFIEGHMDIKGVPVVIVDTAGVRMDADGAEVEGVLRARRMIERADLLLLVVDSSRGLGRGDLSLLQETGAATRIVVANKLDLPPVAEGLPEETVRVSALTGEGLDLLKGAIYETCFGDKTAPQMDGAVVISVRQAEALRGTQRSCRRALEALADDVGLECVAVDVDEALMHLGYLTGTVTTEDVLDEIFSRFCVGK
ncbi:MAG: tRNA uridine-5-carboxymethylaminomethyl(34) synthesis GTPase MnmE [Deltaproteobacteria bacterium]|nr:tRNA uridine-5-carboxymethylaminomethyl(34) synthesis GTPase MnmE [Deltaproteobacteria bacterium]